MQMMRPTRCPEIIVVVVVVVMVVVVVEVEEESSHHHSDIPVEFHSGDTSTASIITHLAPHRRQVQLKECYGYE
jgi:predicted RNA binding protein with dsRBD fold (UPF0201 family)